MSQFGPKIDKDGEKCSKSNFDLSPFFAILRFFKDYQTAFGVCRMAKSVTLVPKMSKHYFGQVKMYSKEGQKLTKMVKMKPQFRSSHTFRSIGHYSLMSEQ